MTGIKSKVKLKRVVQSVRRPATAAVPVGKSLKHSFVHVLVSRINFWMLLSYLAPIQSASIYCMSSMYQVLGSALVCVKRSEELRKVRGRSGNF